MSSESALFSPGDDLSVLKAFERDPASWTASRLEYPVLSPYAQEAQQQETARLGAVWDAEPGSVEEEAAARTAARYFLIRQALRLRDISSNPLAERGTVAERMTQASIELYGQPDQAIVGQLASQELSSLSSAKGRLGISKEPLKNVLRFYENLPIDQATEASETTAPEEAFREAAEAYKEAIMERYADVFEPLLADGPDYVINAEGLYERFQRILVVLQQKETGWENWEVKQTSGGAMGTDIYNETFAVGKKRKSSSALHLAGQVAHEIFAHGRPGVNGRKWGEAWAGRELPGSHDFGEGHGVFISLGFKGTISQRSRDFYTDISFALGQLNGTRMPRPHLLNLVRDRAIVRKQMKGEDFSLHELEEGTARYIGRIYRGSPGTEKASAVSLNDIAYCGGFLKAGNFISQALESGKTTSEVFDYLQQGPFDPTNEGHAAFVERQRESR
jgi:hypothetical protein